MVDPETVWGAFVLRVAALRAAQRVPLNECTICTFTVLGQMSEEVDWMLQCILDGDAPPEAPYGVVVKLNKGGKL